MVSHYDFLTKQHIHTPAKNKTCGEFCSSANCKLSDPGLDICNVSIVTETDFVNIHCCASKWDYLI